MITAAALIRSRLGHAQSSNEEEQLCAVSSASSRRMMIGQADYFLPSPTEFQARGATTQTCGILDLDLEHLFATVFRRGNRSFMGDLIVPEGNFLVEKFCCLKIIVSLVIGL